MNNNVRGIKTCALFEQFNDQALRAVRAANEEAQALGCQKVSPRHILLGVTSLEHNGCAVALKRRGVNADNLLSADAASNGNSTSAKAQNNNPLAQMFQQKQTASSTFLPFDEDADRLLKLAGGMAKDDNVEKGRVTPRIIVLAMLEDGNNDAVALMRETCDGNDLDAVLADVRAAKGDLALAKGTEGKQGGLGMLNRKKKSVLDEMSTNLSLMAREERLDPVFGRAAELRRVMRILLRRRKNNPCLVGEPGVGKTAIAEALALTIERAAPDLPKRLIGKNVYSLNIGSLVADTRYRGDFEDRIKKLLDEVSNREDVILFIDELHLLMGAGSAGEEGGGMDMGNLLKPSLARGELCCIGATTIDEYRKHIEKDAALERRFQPVYVDEPDEQSCRDILDALTPRYEEFHAVSYTPGAIQAAVSLSQRYLPDRRLPDKAIDLMDEAGAMASCGELCGEVCLMKDGVEDVSKNSKSASGDNLVVDEEVIANVLSEWTGIPIERLDLSQRERLLQLESVLHESIVGQNAAVEAVSRAVRRRFAGIQGKRTRPVASFLFAGPTGVGKTELAKTVSNVVYGGGGDKSSDKKSLGNSRTAKAAETMIRIDMSEYMEPHTVSRLIGSPPGYIGYEEGGQLTENVRRSPHSLVLLDEVEKAHPDVLNILLAILDDGRVTDGKGRLVDFTNVVIVLTSNCGSREVQEALSWNGDGASDADRRAAAEAALRGALVERFRPEFLNRFDEIVNFDALTDDDLRAVSRLVTSGVARGCADDLGLKVDVSDGFYEVLGSLAKASPFGARPVRRAVSRLLEDALAVAVLDGFVDSQVDGDFGGEAGGGNGGSQVTVDATRASSRAVTVALTRGSDGKTKTVEVDVEGGLGGIEGVGVEAANGGDAPSSDEVPGARFRERQAQRTQPAM